MGGGKDTKILSFPSVILRLAGKLPLPLLHALGSVLGWAIYGISPTYRRKLRANLQQAGYTDARIRRQAIAAAGQMVAELPAIWFRPHSRVVSLVREVAGFEEVFAARDAGKPLLLLTPHLGCFEMAAQYISLHMPLTVLYRPPKIAWLEPLMLEGRKRPNVRLAPADIGGVRAIFRALKDGEAVGVLPDQVPGEGEGEWSEFFGRPAYTMTLSARLAHSLGANIVFVYGERLARGRGFRIHVQPLTEPLSGEPERDAALLNRTLEGIVRRLPAQYLWGYNRYKVPAGAPPPPAP
jgi:Kdo2-lipid IVA lauroyltransferase/acyltransferase